jgi:hypothetical protein
MRTLRKSWEPWVVTWSFVVQGMWGRTKQAVTWKLSGLSPSTGVERNCTQGIPDSERKRKVWITRSLPSGPHSAMRQSSCRYWTEGWCFISFYFVLRAMKSHCKTGHQSRNSCEISILIWNISERELHLFSPSLLATNWNLFCFHLFVAQLLYI